MDHGGVKNGKTYDVIVVGVGSMGAATCYQLAKRGHRVLGLEQFDIPHESGSHGGQTRIIRKAYGEHIGYVPLLQRAYDNWHALEVETGEQIYYPTGLLYFGEPGNPFLSTIKRSSQDFQIPVRDYQRPDFVVRYPQFDLPDDFQTLEEPEAGFLLPEKCIELMVSQARGHGATIQSRAHVTSWRHAPGEVTVVTGGGTYRAAKLVLTAGPWAGTLIPTETARLQVTRQVLSWIRPRNWEAFTLDHFPTWLWDYQGTVFYGFPILPDDSRGPGGMKVAMHHPVGDTVHPDKVDRNPTAREVARVVDFLEAHFVEGYQELLELKTCLYTNSEDHQFIVDQLPDHDGDVVIAAGFSGHGFKFASAIGEVMADLAIDGATTLPIDFLNVRRFMGGEGL